MTKLGDVLEKIVGGGTPSKSKQEYWDGDIPWATVKDMSDGKFSLYDTKDHISALGLKNSASNLIPAGTVITSTRMGLGRVFVSSRDTAINQDLKALFPNDKIDNNFLLWTIASKARILESLGSGTTVKGIRLELLKDLEINLPTLDSQKKIADILGTYDGLIENNSKRIERLESMARLIYTRSISGNPREIELSEITALIGRGISPRYDEAGDSRVINQRCIRDQKIDLTVARQQSKPIPFTKLIRSGDVLINSTGVGTLGRVAQVFGAYPNTSVDSHVSIVRPNEAVDPYFFGAALLDMQEDFERLGTGATGQTELGRDAIGRLVIPLPAIDVQQNVGEKLKAIRGLIHNLQNKNLKLGMTRDLLLPRLISGDVEV